MLYGYITVIFISVAGEVSIYASLKILAEGIGILYCTQALIHASNDNRLIAAGSMKRLPAKNTPVMVVLQYGLLQTSSLWDQVDT